MFSHAEDVGVTPMSNTDLTSEPWATARTHRTLRRRFQTLNATTARSSNVGRRRPPAPCSRTSNLRVTTAPAGSSPTATTPDGERKRFLDIGVFGARGIPATHSGDETFL